MAQSRFGGAPIEPPPQAPQSRFGGQGELLFDTLVNDPATYFGLDFSKPVEEVRADISARVPEEHRNRVLQVWARDYVAKEKQRKGLGVDDRVRAIARGTITGELADEINAGIKAVTGRAPYDEALAYERERDIAFKEEHPTEATALGLTGALAGGGGGTVAARMAPAGSPLMRRVATNVGQGAVYGGISGFGQGEGGFLNRVEGARNFGITGGILGAPFGLLGGRAGQGQSPSPTELVELFGRANVDPTVPTAFHNRGVGLTSNMLGNTIFGAPIPNAANRQIDQARQETERVARSVSPVHEPVRAGETVQQGTERFARERIDTTNMTPAQIATIAREPAARSTWRTKADALYGRIGGMLIPNATHPLRETRRTLADIERRFATPALQELFANPDVRRVADGLRDAGRQGVPWNDLRNMRTALRRYLDNDEVLRTMDQGEVQRLYDAATDDMLDMARNSARPVMRDFRLPGGGTRRRRETQPEAAARVSHAVQNADRFYAAGAQRIRDTLEKVVGAKSGEQVYSNITRWAQEGSSADVRRLAQVRRSLQPGEWDEIVSTTINRLGRSPRTGEDWSPNYFLNNLRNMSPQGRHLLLGGTRYQGLTRSLEDLENVAAELQRTGRLANFSNTANIGVQAGTLAGMGALGMDKLGYALAAGLGVNMTARILSSPAATRWLAHTLRSGSPTGRSLLRNKNAALVEVFKEDPEMAQSVNDFANEFLGKMNTQR